MSAIGDAVNNCARLESMTTEYGCPVIVSRSAAEAAGLDVGDRQLHQTLVSGRAQTVQFYALHTLADLKV